ENGNAKCEKSNLSNQEQIKLSCNVNGSLPSYVTYDSNAKKWTLLTSYTNSNRTREYVPTGAYWFDGNVELQLNQYQPFIGTVIATQNITTILKDHHKDQKYAAYAPSHYYLQDRSLEKLQKICPPIWPTQ